MENDDENLVAVAAVAAAEVVAAPAPTSSSSKRCFPGLHRCRKRIKCLGGRLFRRTVPTAVTTTTTRAADAGLDTGAAAGNVGNAAGGPVRGSAGTDAAAAAVRAFGFRQAVAALLDDDDGADSGGGDKGRRRPIRKMTIFWSRFPERDHDARSFGQFVALLLNHPVVGRTVRDIDFYADWSGLPVEAMERLFRDALPSHRTLHSFGIGIDTLPARYLQVLTESIPTTPVHSLLTLRIYGINLESATKAQVVQAIADMLSRNAAVESLSVVVELDADQCQRICQALPRNTHLRKLKLRVREVFADTLDGVGASSLGRLSIRGSFAEGAMPSLARQLRTNETIQHLWLYGGVRNSQVLLDLVRTYNYTLAHLEGDLARTHTNDSGRMRGQLDSLVHRNNRLRTTLERLKEPDPDRRIVAPSKELMPRYLCWAGGVPTALFRVMKHWYVHEVTSRLPRPTTIKERHATAAAYGDTSTCTTR